jgi:hypothetical protein
MARSSLRHASSSALVHSVRSRSSATATVVDCAGLPSSGRQLLQWPVGRRARPCQSMPGQSFAMPCWRKPPASSISMIPDRSLRDDGASAGAGSAMGMKAGPAGRIGAWSPSASSRRHRNSRLGEMPCRRATRDTDRAACDASATIGRFSSADRRRVSAVITNPSEEPGPDIGTIQILS